MSSETSDEVMGMIVRAKPEAPSSVSILILPGEQVGCYKVCDRIDQGAMGVIWKALDVKLGRYVVLKLVRRKRAKDARLRREAQALAQLSHPNVVQVHGIEEYRGQLFVVMELVIGKTLEEWQEGPPCPHWKECVRKYVGAGRGLDAAHSKELIHRDFKPSNCMIDDHHGRAKVLDFGLVRRSSTEGTADGERPVNRSAEIGDTLSQSLTRTGTFLGTLAYMSPEALVGGPVDARSDQFSFCISLYEAIYGTRPFGSFAGKTKDEITDVVRKGEVLPAPRGSAVPLRLRRILLRGLAVESKRRWPSMSVLLDELERMSAPRSWRWLAISLGLMTVVGLVLGVGLGMKQYAEVIHRCTGASAQVEGMWDESRQQAVRSAILGTDLTYAEDTLVRVQVKLDDYTSMWAEKYTDVCEATAIRQEQNEEEMSLRMACLREHKLNVEAVVDVLMRADRQVVENSVLLVMGLPALSQCDDVENLRQRTRHAPISEDSEVAREADVLRAGLRAARAERDAGRYALALERVEPVAAQLEEWGHDAVLQAEALLERGRLRNANGRHSEAEEDLMRAYTLAVQHERDDLAFEAAKSLLSVVGTNPSRSKEAFWLSWLAMPLSKLSGSPKKQAAYINILGNILAAQGEYKGAEEHHRQALELLEPVQEDAPRGIAKSLNDLGMMLASQGRYEEAQQLHQRVLEIREQTLGAGHPSVAMSLNNLGIALEGQGHYEQAECHFRRSLKIRERVLSSTDPHLAISVDSLAIVLYMQEQYEEAERYYRRALQMRQDAPEPMGLDLAMSLNNLATALAAQGRREEAARNYEQALRLEEDLLRDDHPRMAYPLIGLAESYRARGDFAAAREYAARAVAIRVASDVDPLLLADARFVLARVLWPDRGERPRALELARQAREVYASVGADERVARIEGWLENPLVP